MTEKRILVCDAKTCEAARLKGGPRNNWEKFRNWHFCPRHAENIRQVIVFLLSHG